MREKRRLLLVTTVPESLAFFSGQASFFREAGLEVHAVSSPGPLLQTFGEVEGIVVHAVPMRRPIRPLEDLVSMIRLWALLRRIAPDIVHANTAKAGLLAMIASWITRTPVRIYHLHGLRYATLQGLTRAVVKGLLALACRLATHVQAVSFSIREAAISELRCPAAKVQVIHRGSVNGVDGVGRFNPGRFSDQQRLEIRKRYGLEGSHRVLGFVGRIVRDKGVPELADAWSSLRSEFPDLHLLLMGSIEREGDAVPQEILRSLKSDPRVHFDRVEDTSEIYAILDVLALPSHREGFPIVLLEAAAMRIPVVTCRVPGCLDAVIDGATGRLVPARNPAALAAGIRMYLADPVTAQAHGLAARRRVLEDFVPGAIWKEQLRQYAELAAAADRSNPEE